MSREQFKEVAPYFLNLEQHQKSSDYLDRLFNAYDKDRSGQMDFEEFIIATTMYSPDSPEEKLRFCFRSLDMDGNNSLDCDELIYAVQLIFKNNPGLDKKVSPEINTPDKVVSLIFEKVDVNKDNTLSCEELINFMNNDPNTFNFLGLNLIFLT